MDPNLNLDLQPSPAIKFRTADGKKEYLQTGEYHRAKIYDTVRLASGAITANPVKLFVPGDKSLLDTNVVQAAKVPAGQVLRIDRVGIDVIGVHGNSLISGSDWRKVLESFYLSLFVNKIEIATGPLTFFPPGVGVSGFTQEAGQSILGNGLMSDSAPLGQVNGTVIDNDYDIVASITALPRTALAADIARPVLDAPVLVRIFVDGMQFQASLVNGPSMSRG